ncbi:MAG: hypothetical protein IJB22_06980 [Clostridia bacterium]|nr:hypothetical protein [Clostridia bacterium]
MTDRFFHLTEKPQLLLRLFFFTLSTAETAPSAVPYPKHTAAEGKGQALRQRLLFIGKSSGKTHRKKKEAICPKDRIASWFQ